MENVEVVQALQAERHLDQSFPDALLVKTGIIFLVSHYFLVEITVVKELHNDARCGGGYLRELASMKECLYPTI